MTGKFLHDGVGHSNRFVFRSDDDDGDLSEDGRSLHSVLDDIGILLEVNSRRSRIGTRRFDHELIAVPGGGFEFEIRFVHDEVRAEVIKLF